MVGLCEKLFQNLDLSQVFFLYPLGAFFKSCIDVTKLFCKVNLLISCNSFNNPEGIFLYNLCFPVIIIQMIIKLHEIDS